MEAKTYLNSLNYPNFNAKFAILGGVMGQFCLLGGYFYPSLIGKYEALDEDFLEEIPVVTSRHQESQPAIRGGEVRAAVSLSPVGQLGKVPGSG